MSQPTGTGNGQAAGTTEEAADDAALAKRVAEGDRSAAAELVDRYQVPLRRFLQRLCGQRALADDLAQETFVRMLRYAAHYDPAYPMRTWLLTIARRLWINQARRDRRRKPCDGWSGMVSGEPRPDETAERTDEQRALRARLDAAMRELTEAQREAVLLFYQQQLSVQQTAEVMGMPIGTVKSHLHRGRATLRCLLQDTVETSRP